MRLNKFIAHSGYCSRRKADNLIAAGKVSVNGKFTQEMGVQINPEKDIIIVDGETLHTPENFTYILLHKPTDYTTTKDDPYTNQTIYALLPKEYHHLNPVGRLDKNSEGLLLLTDDGEFLYEMTHPKHGQTKVYDVRLKYPPKPNDIYQLQKGTILEEKTAKGVTQYRTQPCEITQGRDARHFRVSLHEGRNRQIRKMFKKVGCPVVYLKRISMGPYELGKVAKGKWIETKDIR
jgi:23S rRNA pseudouridine2605 synthase